MQPMTVSEALRRLWPHLSSRRRGQLFVLAALAFAVSFAELATIGAIVPFIGALISPDLVLHNSTIAPIAHYLGISEPGELLLPISLAFGLLGIVAAVVRLLQVYCNVRLTYGLTTELGTSLYRRTLYQPYIFHLDRSTSEVIAALTTKVPLAMNTVLLAVVTICGAVVSGISIVGGLLLIDATTTIAVFGALAVAYSVVLLTSRPALGEASAITARESSRLVRVMQEGLGGIRDILLEHSQEAHTETYRSVDRRLRVSQSYSLVLAQAPRYLIEGVAICVMALTAYFVAARPGGISTALPVLAAIGLGGQRLLPVMQLIFSSLVTIRGNRESLSDIITLLEQPIPSDAMLPHPPMLPFERHIEMRGVGFRYQPHGPFVLRHVSLTLRKGERVGIVGRTGGGKSTLLDILMGLLDPTEGQLAIDDVVVDPLLRRAWQARIAHVPQHIFLTDGTIAENIALANAAGGIDQQRVTAAAQLAGIASDISTMPAGYLTQVGERGAKLSGGQRQRIGIARALYKEADVIVLDEATSALDHETEKAVMSAIERLDQKVTLIIVAHRQSTLAACHAVYEVADGTLIRKGGNEPATALPRRV